MTLRLLTICAYGQLGLLLIAYLYLGTADLGAQTTAGFNDKIAHALGYAVLMCSGLAAFPRRASISTLVPVFWLYSLLIECMQYFLPHRSFSLLDMLANSVGIVIGVLLGILLLPVIQAVYAYAGSRYG